LLLDAEARGKREDIISARNRSWREEDY
jgi:hypothetical protein